MDYIHILPSIIYTRIFILVFSYILQDATTSQESWSLLFAFTKGVISSLKQSAAILSPMNKNVDYNEQNTKALLFSCKTYNLGASGKDFLLLPLYIPEVLQRVRFLVYQTI